MNTPPNQPPTSTPVQAGTVTPAVPTMEDAIELIQTTANWLKLEGYFGRAKMLTDALRTLSSPPPPAAPSAEGQTPRTSDLERIAVNAALLRLFKGEYRESSDRHSDSLFVRDHYAALESQLTAVEFNRIQLRKEINDLHDQLTAANERVAELGAEVARLKAANGHKENEISRALAHAVDLTAQLTTAKDAAAAAERERDEAIKAHGFLWNVVRSADSYFRWAVHTDTIAIEVAHKCQEGVKLTPRWSTDWAIVTPLELKLLKQKADSNVSKAELAQLRPPAVAVEHGRLVESESRYEQLRRINLGHSCNCGEISLCLACEAGHILNEFEADADRFFETNATASAALTSSATPPETPTEAGK